MVADGSWKYETCSACGINQRIAWSVKNELWNKVADEEEGNRMLCLECFLQRADRKNIKVPKASFTFLGWMGTNDIGDILIHKSPVKHTEKTISQIE